MITQGIVLLELVALWEAARETVRGAIKVRAAGMRGQYTQTVAEPRVSTPALCFAGRAHHAPDSDFTPCQARWPPAEPSKRTHEAMGAAS